MQLFEAVKTLENVVENTRAKPASETYSHDTNTAALLFSELAVLISNVEKECKNSDPITFSVESSSFQFTIKVNGKEYQSTVYATSEKPTETLSKLFSMFRENLWDYYFCKLNDSSTELKGETQRLRKQNN